MFAVQVAATSGMRQVFSTMGFDWAQIQDDPFHAPSMLYYSLEDHDYNQAHALLAPDLAAKYAPSDLRRRWEALERARGTISVQLDFESLEEEGTTASLLVELVPTKGDHFDVRLEVERSEGSWRIVSANPDLIPDL
jgi:hypothetical protein